MGKTLKARKRKIGKFNYKANTKKKMKKMEHPKISNTSEGTLKDIIKRVYNHKRGTVYNSKELGLQFNLNKYMKPEEKLAKLEERAEKVPGEFKVTERAAEFYSYLLDKYGENYKAMVNDERNYNQETWRQLRKRILKFKKCPVQYNNYLNRRCQNEGLKAVK